tara:strand:+ start:426 stop:620 length:195 start_codon:yes stop_codon:yes gene_type:complete
MKTIKTNKMNSTNYDHLFTKENILKACVRIITRELADAELGSSECSKLIKELSKAKKDLRELQK